MVPGSNFSSGQQLAVLVNPSPRQLGELRDVFGFNRDSECRPALVRPDRRLVVIDRLGRISASCTLWYTHCPPYQEDRLGFIGHYGAANPASARELFHRAAGNLRQLGCSLLIGPIDGSTWGNYRLVTDPGTDPPFFLEPQNPPDWIDHFLENGFTPFATYFSSANCDLSKSDFRLHEIAERIESYGITLRPLSLANLNDELEKIYEVTLDCFCEALLFSPIDRTTFVEEFRKLHSYVVPELVILAERAGELVGFLFAIPDMLQAKLGKMPNTIVIKTLAVRRSYREIGLGSLLVGVCHETAFRLGFRRAIHALMSESGDVRGLSEKTAVPIRRYALFSRRLEQP